MDALERRADGAAARARRRLRGLRRRAPARRATGLALARAADVPEPSPLYWESFRRQVGRRIVEEAPRRAVARVAAPAFATAAAASSSALLFVRGGPRGSARAGAAPLPAWSALPPAEEDAGLRRAPGRRGSRSSIAAVECAGLGGVPRRPERRGERGPGPDAAAPRVTEGAL